MATKVITMSLDIASIDSAIRQIEQYKQEFANKCEELRQRIAERIAWSASSGFRSALVSDVFYGSAPVNDVQVEVTHQNDLSIVIADGNEAVFIEYGAGVSNNGAAGSSPHPWGAEFGFMIGEYGKGHGKRAVWYYRDEGGNLVGTRGTPAAMPMYRGMQEAINTIDDIVREVFG